MKASKACLALAIAGATLAGTAHAKEQLVLEEVTVTAQKTTELLQDVPVTVNVITGDTFEKNLAFDFQDLGKMVPGLQMQTSLVNQNVTLRGIGTNTQGAQSPRTNTYYDGAYISSQNFSFFSQFDIARFEVLRGPQGTLYGKASPTGSIIIHTRNPDLTKMEGFVQASAGEHSLFNTQFGVSIPVIEDKLGFRVAGLYDENNTGDIEYLNGPDQLSRSKSGRVTMLWKPLDIWDVRLSYTHIDMDSNASAAAVRANGYETYDRVDQSELARFTRARYSQTVLQTNLDLDDYVLTYQGFYATGTNRELEDQDFTSQPLTYQDNQNRFNYMQNHELRIASSGNDFWDWINGLYYGRSKATVTVDNFANFGVRSPFYSTFTLVGLTPTTEDFGAFTHNTFFLSDDWTLTVGARWSHERRNNENGAQTYVTLAPSLGGSVIPVPPVETSSFTKFIAWTGTVKLAYNLDVDSMVYFTIDRGGRGGGQTLDLGASTPDELQDFDPEFSNSFELGYKSDMLDGRLRLNGALYYQSYKDFHSLRKYVPYVTGPTASFDMQQNAKEVIAKGIEMDVTYLFNEYFTGSMSVTYTDAKYEDFKNAACDDPTGTLTTSSLGTFYTCDFSGKRIGGDSGNWGAVLTGGFKYPMESLAAEWYVDALYTFNSMRVSPFFENKSGSYGTMDLFAGLRSSDQVWDVKLWAKNVFDKDAQVVDDYPPTQIGTLPIHYVEERLTNPRQMGVTGIYRF